MAVRLQHGLPFPSGAHLPPVMVKNIKIFFNKQKYAQHITRDVHTAQDKQELGRFSISPFWAMLSCVLHILNVLH
jgi:hypothetical protein